MGLMQCWLPARGSGVAVLRALPIVFSVMIQAQGALGFEGSWGVKPFEPSSTLDSYIPAEDFDLRKTVLDFVDSGILTGRKQPQIQASRLGAAERKSKRPESGPTLVKPVPAKQQAAGDTAAQASPFRKWVRPQVSNSEAAEPELAAPQLASRATKRFKPKPAQPLLLPAKEKAAIAPDLSARSKEYVGKAADEAAARPTTKPKQLKQPKPPNFLTPEPDGTRSTVPPSNLPPLTSSQLNLRKKIRQVLTHYYNRPLNTRDRSPWELMHAMLSFEAHSKVLQGGPKGEPITAVGWLCFNQACKRRTLMYVDDDGELKVRVGPALQGHRGQLLAMLAQSRINENYPLLVEGKKLKVADLIEMEKRTCYPRTELTFKLIALMHYLDSDATWLNDQGMEWDIPRLIAEELRQPVRGAACGGTHRLSGLTLAYKTREKRGEQVNGQYLKAKQFVQRYQQYAYRLQNRDGSFSTEWFRGPGNENDIDRKLKTTGHILEWLLYASSEKELNHWKTTKAANYLVNIMSRNRYKDWEAGPLGHAIHALLVYDRLVFAPYDQAKHSPLAAKPTSKGKTGRKR